MAASPTAWLQEWPNRCTGSRAEGGEALHMLLTKKSLSKNERHGENTVLGGTRWGGNTFICGAVITSELAFVPLKGGGVKSLLQRRQGGQDRERGSGTGRLQRVCPRFLQQMFNRSDEQLIC